jgi:hypothetical protein
MKVNAYCFVLMLLLLLMMMMTMIMIMIVMLLIAMNTSMMLFFSLMLLQLMTLYFKLGHGDQIWFLWCVEINAHLSSDVWRAPGVVRCSWETGPT